MRKPDRVFKDKDGNIYKLFGVRLLKNDYSIVKSWFGCADIDDVKLIGSTLTINYNNGVLTLNDMEELSPNACYSNIDIKKQNDLIEKPNETCQRANKDLKDEFSKGYNG